MQTQRPCPNLANRTTAPGRTSRENVGPPGTRRDPHPADVELLLGERSRDKVVLVRGVEATSLRAVLP